MKYLLPLLLLATTYLPAQTLVRVEELTSIQQSQIEAGEKAIAAAQQAQTEMLQRMYARHDFACGMQYNVRYICTVQGKFILQYMEPWTTTTNAVISTTTPFTPVGRQYEYDMDYWNGRNAIIGPYSTPATAQATIPLVTTH